MEYNKQVCYSIQSHIVIELLELLFVSITNSECGDCVDCWTASDYHRYFMLLNNDLVKQQYQLIKFGALSRINVRQRQVWCKLR